MRGSQISAAIVAALVGYGSSVAILVAAAAAVGATPAQTISWLLAISLAKAIGTAFLSTYARIPLVLAWSTPGVVLIAATTGIDMSQAVGAFLFAAVLIFLTGLISPLERLIARIPDTIANAMLAGVLFPFVVKLAPSAGLMPAVVLPMIAAFLIIRLKSPAWATLGALALGLLLAAFGGELTLPDSFALPVPVLIRPDFDLGVMIGLGLPLYIVTMASQNLPGFAISRSFGYTPPVRLALQTTGGLSAIAAFFGAHSINMAAITAAICMDESTHPDRSQRWKTGLAYAGAWVVLGLCAPFVLELVTNLPAPLLSAIVAIALIGALLGALQTSFGQSQTAFPALMTFIVAASGISFAGIGAPFWGLAAGLACLALTHATAK